MAKPHMIMFPFMSRGHTLSMLNLAKMIACRGVKLTIFTTPYNAPFILQSLSQTSNVSLEILPFPQCEELPPGCENTDQLVEKMVGNPNQTRPVCIVSDLFLWWTQESGSKFNIPRVNFSGMSAYAASVIVSVGLTNTHKDVVSDSEPFEVPGLPTRVILTRSELWEQHKNLDEDNPWTGLFAEFALADQHNTHGTILDTFTELEPIYAPHIQRSMSGSLWCLGPTVAWDKEGRDAVEGAGANSHVWMLCADWLAARATRPGSVIYVSFGTQANVPDAQMTEIAWGLVSTRWDFVLVVRSGSWRVPDGFHKSMAGKGLIIREWAPQRRVLGHPAVGGFFTHCGWNSIMESLSCGVPLLTWAMLGDQYLNEKMVVEELGAGIRILNPTDRSTARVIGRKVVQERVDELMGGEMGRMTRSRAAEIKRAARMAVEEGGSSYTNLSSFIEHFCDKNTVNDSEKI